MNTKRIMDNARAALADTRTPAQVAIDATAEKLGAAVGKAAQHTPGPMYAEPSGSTGLGHASVRVGDSMIVADVYGTSDDGSDADGLARIFAAAPDLLAALQLVYANAAESPEWIRERIGPAIAKAGGVA